MNTKIQNIINEEISKLPIEKQEVINSFNWIKTSEEISKKYLLNDEQINTFQLETFLVLIGLVDEEKYIDNLEKKIGINKEIAVKIKNETIKNIITPMVNYYLSNNLQKNTPEWEKNLNFILSGGDYTVFISTPNTSYNDTEKEKLSTNNQIEVTNTIPINKSAEVENLKNKFTI